jgi:hypothetical protein
MIPSEVPPVCRNLFEYWSQEDEEASPSLRLYDALSSIIGRMQQPFFVGGRNEVLPVKSPKEQFSDLVGNFFNHTQLSKLVMEKIFWPEVTTFQPLAENKAVITFAKPVMVKIPAPFLITIAIPQKFEIEVQAETVFLRGNTIHVDLDCGTWLPHVNFNRPEFVLQKLNSKTNGAALKIFFRRMLYIPKWNGWKLACDTLNSCSVPIEKLLKYLANSSLIRATHKVRQG